MESGGLAGVLSFKLALGVHIKFESLDDKGHLIARGSGRLRVVF